MAPKLQPHVVLEFDPIETNNVSSEDALNSLITGSVKPSSSKTYQSALHTMSKFLHTHRKLSLLAPFPAAATMTREEFTLFLYFLQKQGSASATTYRSALVYDQRRSGVDMFAIEGTYIKAAKEHSKD